jgi:diacylglycerol kinase family enzyme
VSISADPSIPVQMDGDLIGHGSIKFSSYGEGIEVVVP